MKKVVFATLLLLVAAPVFGQENVGGVAEMDAPPAFVRLGDVKAEALRLIKSSENRERAWGAYLIGRHGLEAQTPVLVELLSDQTLGYGTEESLVRQATLDSLILLDAKVPADVLRTLYTQTPDEAIILLSRAAEENRDVLLELFDGAPVTERADARWLALGNLLTETKAQGFAAALLKPFRIEAHFTIVDGDLNVGGGCGGGHGCGYGTIPTGFPPIGFYELTSYARRGAVVVAPGNHIVYYLRALRRGCGNGWLAEKDIYRAEYLADLLGVAEEELGLDARPDRTILCKDERQCRRELVAERRKIEQAYAGVVSRLVENGLLDASDAAALSLDITFHLYDERGGKSFPLPTSLQGVKLFVQ